MTTTPQRADLRRMVYRIASVLLQYPDREQQDAQTEIASAVEALDDGAQREVLRRFLSYCVRKSLLELQEEYVRTFDFDKRASLYLTYSLYGDQRKRGLALLRLKRLYEAGGLPYAGSDLPDYLPAVLEFAAFAAEEHGAYVLEELRLPIELLRHALRASESPYAFLVDAVSYALPALTPEQIAALGRLAAEGPPREEVGLEPFARPELTQPLNEQHSRGYSATRRECAGTFQAQGPPRAERSGVSGEGATP